MPHPEITVRGGAAFEAIPLFDEEGRSVVVAVMKATFAFDAAGALAACEPEPITLAPLYHGDPERSSLRLDSDTALGKHGTDVVVLGHARSHNGPVESLDVGARVGPVQKVARVFGDRMWTHAGGTAVLSRPRPFEALPLLYERTFGGRDNGPAKPRNFDPRNPVGIGFGAPLAVDGEARPAPNIVDPGLPAPRYGEPAAPVGFGFVAPNWQPRASFAGTYDEAWDKTRKPLLPADFSRRYFNAASPGLVSAEFLRGDEEVTLINIGASARVDFRLPVAGPAAAKLYLRSGPAVVAEGALDTIVIDADAQRVSLVWRASVATKDGIQDVLAIKVRCELALPPAG